MVIMDGSVIVAEKVVTGVLENLTRKLFRK